MYILYFDQSLIPQKFKPTHRNASIGSSTAALIAGYSPEAIATIKLVIKAAMIALQGITKAKSMAVAIPKPLGFQNNTYESAHPINKVSIKN
jgi:hypothetical protein